MAMGIGIGMGISGTSPVAQGVAGWFVIDVSCGFDMPKDCYIEFLEGMPYKTGDYIETRIKGPYEGKRILLGELVKSKPSPATFIDVEPGSLVYNACQK